MQKGHSLGLDPNLLSAYHLIARHLSICFEMSGDNKANLPPSQVLIHRVDAKSQLSSDLSSHWSFPNRAEDMAPGAFPFMGDNC